MEMSEVKHVLVRIERLKEMRDKHKKEAKACQEDIDDLLEKMTKRVIYPEQDGMPGLGAPGGTPAEKK